MIAALINKPLRRGAASSQPHPVSAVETCHIRLPGDEIFESELTFGRHYVLLRIDQAEVDHQLRPADV